MVVVVLVGGWELGVGGEVGFGGVVEGGCGRGVSFTGV